MKSHHWLPAAVLAAIVVAAWSWRARAPAEPPATAPMTTAVPVPAAASPAFVGAQTCATCHPTQYSAWKGSHHALAMQHADATSVLGDFANARFTHGGVNSTFFTRDGRYYVNTDGPDGALRDYEIKYTFGVFPLQQYLVEFPGGRLQALGIAWDARPRAEGGQRWFHLYPDETIDHTDELHWTKLSQNWNHMCAECHSTNLKKNFSLASGSFDTTWSEINVSCEACHGPASRHVQWAGQTGGTQAIANKGLVVALDERTGVAWTRAAGARIAARSEPRLTTREIDVCARCHSRRSSLVDASPHGQPLLDTHLPALLTDPLYYADGQIRQEDFEYGSFMQSRMARAGVNCSDCHEPHSQQLRAPGNATCLQCHDAGAYDSTTHHFHATNGKGGACVACHMPTTNFMVVHARHDHSLRVPRPDLSMKLGSPNACTQCHADKPAAWADAQLRTWYGDKWPPGWHFGEALHAAASAAPGAGADLAATALAPQVPDIARATAASLLQGYLEPGTFAVTGRLLADPSPMVRRAALGIVDRVPAEHRWELAGRLLTDAVLAVRIEAARVLSVSSRLAPTGADRKALDAAVQEFVDVAMASAEHPQSHVNLGLLYQGLEDSPRAEAAYRQAIALDPAYVPAWVNLADLFRATGQNDRVEETLLAARTAVGENAALEHALGLHLVRTQQMPKAMEALERSARLEPGNARYAYVLAVALNGTGESKRAIEVLESVLAEHPRDRDTLIALVSFNLARKNEPAARKYATILAETYPNYGNADQVLQQLSAP